MQDFFKQINKALVFLLFFGFQGSFELLAASSKPSSTGSVEGRNAQEGPVTLDLNEAIRLSGFSSRGSSDTAANELPPPSLLTRTRSAPPVSSARRAEAAPFPARSHSGAEPEKRKNSQSVPSSPGDLQDDSVDLTNPFSNTKKITRKRKVFFSV